MSINSWFNKESSSGVLLILATLLAIIVANSALNADYQRLLQAFASHSRYLPHNLLGWVNDGLMAVFFFYIGLEVKQEIKTGSLSTPAQASLPVIGALGGMLVPAFIYWLVNVHYPLLQAGWAIPVATDIAFALGIIALLSERVPVTVKYFLMALAIIDDLGAILIIAFGYSTHLALSPLLVGLGLIVGLALCNYLAISARWPRFLLGIALWLAVLASGIHPTIAGVLAGLLFPAGPSENSPASQVAHALRIPINFIILPLFAFANAGIQLTGFQTLTETWPLSLGILLGLVAGKPVGIVLSCFLAVRFKLARLPANCNFKLLAKVSVLCGIGFTMAIFIASLAFISPALLKMAKMAILSGSLLAAVVGYLLLRWDS